MTFTETPIAAERVVRQQKYLQIWKALWQAQLSSKGTHNKIFNGLAATGLYIRPNQTLLLISMFIFTTMLSCATPHFSLYATHSGFATRQVDAILFSHSRLGLGISLSGQLP